MIIFVVSEVEKKAPSLYISNSRLRGDRQAHLNPAKVEVNKKTRQRNTKKQKDCTVQRAQKRLGREQKKERERDDYKDGSKDTQQIDVNQEKAQSKKKETGAAGSVQTCKKKKRTGFFVTYAPLRLLSWSHLLRNRLVRVCVVKI